MKKEITIDGSVCSVPSLTLLDSDLRKTIVFLPAAGYRNNSNLNNAGSNGYYWSSSLNSNNSNNAYNMNFNSGNHNVNNNNRYNGQSVRAVRSALTLNKR